MQLYRKAIAAFLAALLGVVALFVPAVEAHVPAEAIAFASAILAALATYFVENRLDGYNVLDLARTLLRAARDVEAERVASGQASGAAADALSRVVGEAPRA